MDFDSCLAALTSPGVVAFPTDTFFALSCDPLQESALSRLRSLKGLSAERPLPLLCPASFDFRSHGFDLSERTALLMREYWPGKVTLVIACNGPLSSAVGRPEDGAVGVRVPDGSWLLAMLERFGRPVVGTSANPTGAAPASSADLVREYFGNAVAWIGDENAGGGKASTVIDLTDDDPIVIREGAIPSVEILELIGAGGVR